jgi:hypothetical protein
MWLWEARAGTSAPLHVHHREDEQLLLIEGEASFVIGDQRLDAGPGDLVFLPRGVPHSYLVTSELARLVGIVTPGGFESFFAAVGQSVSSGVPDGPSPSLEAMTRVAPRYGLEILGPPPDPQQ